MPAQEMRPKGPFLIAFAIVGVVSLAVARLPSSLVIQLERHRPLSEGQAGWAVRLLVITAVVQAAYVAFTLFRSERIGALRATNQKMRRQTKPELIASAARSAAGIPLLTLVYGLSAFAASGERGSFWLFQLLALAQLAWHFRQIGQLESWIAFQPEYVTAPDSLRTAGRGSAANEDDDSELAGPT